MKKHIDATTHKNQTQQVKLNFNRYFLPIKRKQTKERPTINTKINEDILPKVNSSCLNNLRHSVNMEAVTNTRPTA